MGDARFAPAAAGFVGKLPSRGDFLRVGLTNGFADAADDWCARRLGTAREGFGAQWRALYFEAPIWRFFIAPGLLGAEAVLGVWLPSIDKVGRQFPLVIAATAANATSLEGGAGWLENAAGAGAAAIAADWEPARLADALSFTPGAQVATDVPAPGASLWWTDGGPYVAATSFALAGLPDAVRFALMLRDGSETNEADSLWRVRHARDGIDGDP